MGHWEVGRIPRAVRDALKGPDGDMNPATMGSGDIDRDSPLYLVADQLAAESTVIASMPALTRAYATPEPLDVVGFQVSVGDGNGPEFMPPPSIGLGGRLVSGFVSIRIGGLLKRGRTSKRRLQRSTFVILNDRRCGQHSAR